MNQAEKLGKITNYELRITNYQLPHPPIGDVNLVKEWVLQAVAGYGD